MSYIILNIRVSMSIQPRAIRTFLFGILLSGFFVFSVACSQINLHGIEVRDSLLLNQKVFTTAEEANNTFELALKQNNIKLLQAAFIAASSFLPIRRMRMRSRPSLISKYHQLAWYRGAGLFTSKSEGIYYSGGS
jgi:hypothetical protein